MAKVTAAQLLVRTLKRHGVEPERPLVVLIGDGGMAFHSWELHTALRFNAAVVVVVGNDCG